MVSASSVSFFGRSRRCRAEGFNLRLTLPAHSVQPECDARKVCERCNEETVEVLIFFRISLAAISVELSCRTPGVQWPRNGPSEPSKRSKPRRSRALKMARILRDSVSTSNDPLRGVQIHQDSR